MMESWSQISNALRDDPGVALNTIFLHRRSWKGLYVGLIQEETFRSDPNDSQPL